MLWLTVSLLLLCFAAQAQDSRSTLPEEFNHPAGATIRISGDTTISTLLRKWQTEFHRAHPEVKFENRLTGPASAMAGLYTKVADIAFAGHELLTSESMAFEWIFHYKPLSLEVLSGSVDGPYFAPAFFVSKQNPIRALTLEQARLVLGCDRAGKPARIWGELGLTGAWANNPIHVYAFQTESELGVFIRRKVLKNSYKWNCQMATFAPASTQPNTRQDASAEILSALRRDAYGIAVSNVRYGTSDVKILPLANSNAEDAFPPSPQNIIGREYALARPFFAYLNREPGKPVRSDIATFLRFLLSKAGQEEVLNQGDFLPLDDSIAREQLAKLN